MRGPSAPRGWLSSFIRDLSGESPQANRRRLILAFALGIAIIEITAMAIPSHTIEMTQAPIERLTVVNMHIVHRAKPKPKPTPKPIVHAKIIAETHVQPHIVNPGAPARHARVHRIASARPMIHTKFHSKPTVHVPMGGHGIGTSKSAKAVTGGVGPGGTGTGESGQGQGTGGAPAAHEPCGYVDFIATGNPTTDQSTGRVWEYIQMTVHFPDGSYQSVDLDYPWYYPNDMADPWSAYNEKNNPDAPTTFQFPPQKQAATEPPLVQYVVQHTSSDGFTKLRPCPQ